MSTELKILKIVLLVKYRIYKPFITFINQVRYSHFARIQKDDDDCWEIRANCIVNYFRSKISLISIFLSYKIFLCKDLFTYLSERERPSRWEGKNLYFILLCYTWRHPISFFLRYFISNIKKNEWKKLYEQGFD